MANQTNVKKQSERNGKDAGNKESNNKNGKTISTKAVGRKDNNYKMKNNKMIETEQKKNYFLSMIVFVTCILPFVVRLKVYKTNMDEYPWFIADEKWYDVFLYYKQWIFVIAAVIMAVIIIVKVMTEKKSIRFTSAIVPLILYAILALASAIFSQYRIFSFTGSFELYENVFVLIGYCVVVYYAFLSIHSEKDLETIIKCILISVIVMSLLGLFQYLGMDFFATKLGYNTIIPIENRSDEGLTFSFGKNRVYLTLYNPNYVGVYATLLVPIIMVLLFFQKKVVKIIISILAIIGLIVCAVGSQSLTAFISLGVTVVVFLAFMWRNLLKRFYITIPIIIIMVISVLIINHVSGQVLVNKFKSAMNVQKTEYALTEIETLDDRVYFNYNGNVLNVQYTINEDQTMTFFTYDEAGNIVEGSYDQTNNTYVLTDQRFSGIVIAPDSQIADAFDVTIEGRTWRFTNQAGDLTYYFINRYNRLDKIITAPSAVFTGYEAIASNRGYIWSRTIPLLKDYILLGSGPDTFTLVFPQQDYVNLTTFGFGDNVMTKPHNLYLQMWVQTGLLSLISFLVFYLMYFISCVRLYSKGCFHSYYAKVGLAIFIGSISYMISGLSNDSTVTVAPIFWCLMGVGLAANYKAKPIIMEEVEARKQKREEKEKQLDYVKA